MARAQMTSKSKTAAKQSRLLSEPASIMGPRLVFILSVVALCIMGLIMVYSASSIAAYDEFGDTAYYFKRQAVFLCVGIVLCIICARIPYSIYAMPVVFIVFWVLTVGLLSLTAFGMGVSALGAERSIVVAGFALQPAEFAKITVLISVASIVQMRIEGALSSRRFLVIVLVAAIVPLILIYRQPDLGTAIILAVGIIALSLLAGISWKIIALIFGVVIAYIVFACITQPYHLERITSMLDPWMDPQGKGYQSIQSLYAFGSGGVFGTGLGLSKQKYLYLPYAHTDFIYAIIGEELGLVGAVLVAALFGLFIFAGMRICRNAPDLYGCMLSGSFTVMIGFQACVNMACVTGIAPVTGKALPLISYGGSSMVATMIMIGIILSVSFRSKLGMSYERRRDDLRVIEGGKNRRSEGASAGVPSNVVDIDSRRAASAGPKRTNPSVHDGIGGRRAQGRPLNGIGRSDAPSRSTAPSRGSAAGRRPGGHAQSSSKKASDRNSRGGGAGASTGYASLKKRNGSGKKR